MKQFKLTVLHAITVMILVAVTFTACKKDPFTEQQALAAQKDLLTLKFSYDLSISQVNLQIQRAGDSAKIVLQNLINSGASALALAQFNYSTALNLQNLVNLKNELMFRDSLNRASSLASLKITDSLNRLNAAGGIKTYTVRVVDARTNVSISGATVRVLPWQATAYVTATTNSDGIATFNNITLDANALFYAVDPATTVTSATTIVPYAWVNAGNSIQVFRYTTASPGVTVSGTLFADKDLTNGSTVENAGAGLLVTYTTTNNTNISGSVSVPNTTWQFSTSTDANGKYSVGLPASYFFTVSVPASITAQQKQFVNYFEGLDNPFTAVPRIDSVSTTMRLTGGSLATNTNYAQYYQLPADSLSGAPVVLLDKNNTLFNYILSGVRTTGTPVDTLFSSFFIAGNTINVGFNNGFNSPSGVQNFTAANDPLVNYKIRLNSSFVAIPDTLPVTLVDLSGKLIASAPNLVMITTAQGKMNRIELKRVPQLQPFSGQVLPGAGGSFNVTALGGLSVIQGTTSTIKNNTGAPGTVFQSGSATTFSANTTWNFFYSQISGRAGNVVPR